MGYTEMGINRFRCDECGKEVPGDKSHICGPTNIVLGTWQAGGRSNVPAKLVSESTNCPHGVPAKDCIRCYQANTVWMSNVEKLSRVEMDDEASLTIGQYSFRCRLTAMNISSDLRGSEEGKVELVTNDGMSATIRVFGGSAENDVLKKRIAELESANEDLQRLGVHTCPTGRLEEDLRRTREERERLEREVVDLRTRERLAYEQLVQAKNETDRVRRELRGKK